MDLLPQEIITAILALLGDANMRNARLACTAWFNCLNYSKFVLYFASATTLPQIVDRLSKYQHPIDLELRKTLRCSISDILEHIPKLTQLRSFQIFDSSEHLQEELLEPDEFMKLSTLTNLELLIMHHFDNVPVEIVQHFPRLKHCNSFLAETDRLLELIPLCCPNYGIINLDEETPLSKVPVSVSDLTTVHVRPFHELARLTRLEKLLVATTNEMTVLEHCPDHVTELCLLSDYGFDASALSTMHSVLPKLRKLALLTFQDWNTGDVSFSNLTQVTRMLFSVMTIVGQPFLTSLPTSLQDLEFDLCNNTQVDLSDLSHLVQLTKLEVKIYFQVQDIEPFKCLTNLLSLWIMLDKRNASEDNQRLSFSSLTNLMNLELHDVETDTRTIQNLTKLKSLAVHYDGENVDCTIWESLHYLTNLTKLSWIGCNEQQISNFTTIAKLPLRSLTTNVIHSKVQLHHFNYWQVISTITSLNDLSLETLAFTEEDQLLYLIALNNLTSLTIPSSIYNTKSIHITSLTTLQSITRRFQTGLDFNELSTKLTRLLSLHKI